jgi:hypothetical protein
MNMRRILLLLAMILMPTIAMGQIFFGDKQINPSKLKPWIPKNRQIYQRIYNFGYGESASSLILIVTRDTCYGQVISIKTTGNKINIRNYENLKKVRIDGNKFYSGKTNGEFVRYRMKKGLVINNSWSPATKRGKRELGVLSSSLKKHYKGKYSYASWRYLKPEELIDMSIPNLRIMRNEIYARYGFIFKANGDLDNYFRKQSWYKAVYNDVSDYLTGLEKQNIEVIKMVENK